MWVKKVVSLSNIEKLLSLILQIKMLPLPNLKRMETFSPKHFKASQIDTNPILIDKMKSRRHWSLKIGEFRFTPYCRLSNKAVGKKEWIQFLWDT
jgi:hypothetical protein